MSTAPLVPEPSEQRLNKRQLLDYEEHRRNFITWLETRGKDPEKVKGYSPDTVRITSYRVDQFYRWVWDSRGYTTEITVDDADDYLRYLVELDASKTHKSKCVLSIKRLFSWRDYEWDPDITFNGSESATNPRDYFTKSERTAVREAALEYGSVPGYNDLTPEQRSRWKVYLAQRFEKPKSELTKDDWNRANGWKTPSLVWAAMDAGLRPREVNRAQISWVDRDNRVLRIPNEDSTKNRDNWIVSLRDQTARMLSRWLDERETYPKYDDTNTLWLTRESNPYTSQSLNYVLDRLCEIADIDTKHRDITWYCIRHSVGTYMTRKEDLAAAQTQLRHKSEMTTMKYDQTPVEDRRDALDRMG